MDQTTAQPVLWTREDPCPPWCAYGDRHRDSDVPDDRQHLSEPRSVQLLTMPAVDYGQQAPAYLPDSMTSTLVAQYREREPRLSINDGTDDFHTWMTLAEAEAFAHQLLAQVRAARGLDLRPCLDMPCPDVACGLCYPLPASADSP